MTPPPGLVAWWPGDGNALDYRGTNDGVLLSGTSYAPGLIGTAFAFDGTTNAGVVISNSPVLNPSGPFSVEAWIRADPQQPAGDFMIVDKSHGAAVPASGWFLQGDQYGKVSFGFGIGINDADPPGFPEVTTPPDVRDGQWHHVVGVYTGTQLQIYLDSVLKDTLGLAVTPAANNRDVEIGRWWGGGVPARNFNGLIDEVSFYGRALSAAEIAALYNAGSAGKCKWGLKLGAPTRTNNQVQFTLNCESGVTYVIERSSDMQNWTPVVTNSDSSIARLITAGAPDGVAFYRARRGPLPIFAAAIAAVSIIDLKGNNIATDSFDSGDSNYSNGGLYPTGNPSKAKAQGDVCADGILRDSLLVGAADIKGKLRTGPWTTIVIGTNWTVGDRAWVEGGSLGIETGHSATDFNVVFQDVTLPTMSWGPKGQSLPAQTINGTTYQYVFNNSGDYQINNLNGNVYISTNANVRLKITGDYVTSSGIIRLDPNNASLQIFMVGSTFSLGGGALIDNPSGHAERFYLFGLPTCTTITFGGNGNFYGAIYAPEATFNLGGGGNYTYDFVGSSVTGSVTMNGHFNFHYDENLARVGPVR